MHYMAMGLYFQYFDCMLFSTTTRYAQCTAGNVMCSIATQGSVIVESNVQSRNKDPLLSSECRLVGGSMVCNLTSVSGSHVVSMLYL